MVVNSVSGFAVNPTATIDHMNWWDDNTFITYQFYNTATRNGVKIAKELGFKLIEGGGVKWVNASINSDFFNAGFKKEDFVSKTTTFTSLNQDSRGNIFETETQTRYIYTGQGAGHLPTSTPPPPPPPQTGTGGNDIINDKIVDASLSYRKIDSPGAEEIEVTMNIRNLTQQTKEFKMRVRNQTGKILESEPAIFGWNNISSGNSETMTISSVGNIWNWNSLGNIFSVTLDEQHDGQVAVFYVDLTTGTIEQQDADASVAPPPTGGGGQNEGGFDKNDSGSDNFLDNLSYGTIIKGGLIAVALAMALGMTKK